MQEAPKLVWRKKEAINNNILEETEAKSSNITVDEALRRFMDDAPPNVKHNVVEKLQASYAAEMMLIDRRRVLCVDLVYQHFMDYACAAANLLYVQLLVTWGLIDQVRLQTLTVSSRDGNDRGTTSIYSRCRSMTSRRSACLCVLCSARQRR